jgi:3-hydroxyisobutyrate dehydrogenase-like beta-hydroxyacid dehydrogenase
MGGPTALNLRRARSWIGDEAGQEHARAGGDGGDCRGARFRGQGQARELETAFAKAHRVPLLLANLTQQVYRMARAQELNKQDGTAVIKIFEQLVGVSVGTE